MATAEAGKLSKSLVGVAGEYLVAGELSRRGYIATLTLRNTRGIDILASNSDATRSVGIQVKANQGELPRWVLTKKAEDDVGANAFYVFVCLPPDSPAVYYVVPREDVAKSAKDGHMLWLEKPGKRGQAHQPNDVRVFTDPEGRYRGRWDLLGLG